MEIIESDNNSDYCKIEREEKRKGKKNTHNY